MTGPSVPASTGSAPAPAQPKKEGERLIRVGIIAFIATVVGLLAFAALPSGGSSSTKNAPGFAVSEVAQPANDGSFRVTLDTSDSDVWVRFNLSAGSVSEAGEPADIAARRFMLRAEHGAVDLGNASFDDVVIPPDAKWVHDEGDESGEGGDGGENDDASNPLLSRWYDYSFLSHKLRPKGATYGVRLASGRGVALLRVDSYECEPEGVGCLTLSYRIVPSETR